MKNIFRGDVLRGEEIPYSKKILKSFENLMDYLPHIKKIKDEDGEICYGGKAIYEKSNFPLKVRIKPNQFLYLQAVAENESEEHLKVIQFYIATLNHFLMKEISWN